MFRRETLDSSSVFTNDAQNRIRVNGREITRGKRGQRTLQSADFHIRFTLRGARRAGRKAHLKDACPRRVF